MYRLERLRHLRPPLPGDLGEDVAVEMYGAALVLGLGKCLLEHAEHPERLVAGDQSHARQPAAAQPQQELLPRLLGLGEAPGAAHDLATPVRVHADGDHDGDVLVGATTASPQVDAVDEEVRVFAGERPGAPRLHALERLFDEVGHGAGRHPGPQSISETSSIRRVLTPARHVSMMASSTLVSRQR